MFNGEPAAIRVSRQLSRMPKVPTRIMRASGGLIPDDPSNPFSGPIVSDVPGRTDQINTHVPSGSYVIPADIVSAIGEGNSLTGLKVLSHQFSASPRNAPEAPYTASAAPWGSQMPHAAMGRGEGLPTAPTPPQAGLVAPKAHGGETKAHPGDAAPVVLAGGEFVIHPEDVARLGDGDIKRGHKVLDQFVKDYRQKTIKTLQKLPGPAKS